MTTYMAYGVSEETPRKVEKEKKTPVPAMKQRRKSRASGKGPPGEVPEKDDP